MKHAIADYEVTPSMAIFVASLAMNMPKPLTAVGGIDAVTHAREPSMFLLATDFTDGHALEALNLLKLYTYPRRL